LCLITGTNGKTSVSFLVRHLLQQAGHRCGLIGTVEYDLGARVVPAMRTTPESPEIHEYLAAMVTEGCIYGVMEVSSHALLQHRVHDLKFDTVAFTNLTQDHLDYHGSMENYYEAKRSLFELHAKGGMIVNGDDQYGSLLAQEYAVTTVGKTESARLRIEAVELDQSGSRFRFDGTQFQTPLIGRHNVENSAMAIAIVQQAAGISLDQCAEGLAKARPVPGRFCFPHCCYCILLRQQTSILIVSIYYHSSFSMQFKETFLGFIIMLHATMIVEMILSEICKDRSIKLQAVHTVLQQSMRTHFHHTIDTSFCYHSCQIFMNFW
jgi:UDP-N-acetylmuramyl-tripeptide synthetase